MLLIDGIIQAEVFGEIPGRQYIKTIQNNAHNGRLHFIADAFNIDHRRYTTYNSQYTWDDYNNMILELIPEHWAPSVEEHNVDYYVRYNAAKDRLHIILQSCNVHEMWGIISTRLIRTYCKKLFTPQQFCQYIGYSCTNKDAHKTLEKCWLNNTYPAH